MQNIQQTVRAFLCYLQLEKNYSDYTIDFYKEDIDEFLMFIIEQSIEDLHTVSYFDARLYLTKLYNR